MFMFTGILSVGILSTGIVLTSFASLMDAPDGDEVQDFYLESSDGEAHALRMADSAYRGTVLFFLSVDCPMAKLYAPGIADVEREYRDEGIRFLGIDSNAQDSAADVSDRKAKAKIDFPVLLDPLQVIANRLGVTRSPEILLLDDGYRVLYRGAIDDQYGVGTQRPKATETWFLDALNAYLAGRPIPVDRTEAKGCLVARVDEGESVDINFHRDVAKVLNRNCVECHRPGQIGPMSLLDYKEVRGWAPMISEVVLEGRMPPWHADPAHGTFLNERRVTETDKKILSLWASHGTPEGDPNDAETRALFEDDDWVIGSPDLIVELPKVESIPATGTIPYRYIVVDPELEEDWWVQSVEIQPTNREVTHHVLVLLLPKDKEMRDVLRDREFFLSSGHFAVDVPGARPIEFPEGCGLLLEAGTKFLFQMHYTPNGEEAEDQTRMAMRFVDAEDVERVVKTRAIVNMGIDIPPRTKGVTFEKRYTFSDSVQLLGLFPHMHARGQAFRFDLEREGKQKTLLDVPRYDFNWQHTYIFQNPHSLTTDDVLRLTAVYDNSVDNPMNPDPNKRVRWGDQTWEEMMVGYVTYIEGEEPLDFQ